MVLSDPTSFRNFSVQTESCEYCPTPPSGVITTVLVNVFWSFKSKVLARKVYIKVINMRVRICFLIYIICV